MKRYECTYKGPEIGAILSYILTKLCGAGIAERVSVWDWLSLRYAAIITLPVSNPGLCS